MDIVPNKIDAPVVIFPDARTFPVISNFSLGYDVPTPSLPPPVPTNTFPADSEFICTDEDVYEDAQDSKRRPEEAVPSPLPPESI